VDRAFLAPRWVVGPPPDPEDVERLRADLDLPRALCALLAGRGHSDPSSAKAFLRPLLTDLHPAETMPDMERAVERILSALGGGEGILVHGDYDVDGMAGTALLTRWLRRLGGKVTPFVPHRSRDGYDLGPAGMETALAHACTLVVTVDCGILAIDSVEEAGRAGLDVIVTDHHEPGPVLPPAVAVVNPRREDSSYPDPDLAGTGVVFKLCQALARASGADPDALLPHLDLVGLATVADLVPLVGENRILARFGLRALSQSEKPGLRALMEVAGIRPDGITAGAIGFGLAPRLNALGRLGEASDGLDLLLTEDPVQARRLADRAEETNSERKDMDSRSFSEAMAQVEATFQPDRDFGLVLASQRWHPGVIGIVASRIVEQTHRPAILFALQGDRGRGSGRSIPPYHLLDGIRSCGRHLVRYGGHRMAAGIEIRVEDLPAFKDDFNAHAREVLEGRDLRPDLQVELEVGLSEMSWDLLRFMRHLGPHGMGNPAPNLLARGVAAAGPPRVVGENHLRLRLEQDGTALEAIGFGLAGRLPAQRLGPGPLDVVFQLKENRYRGQRKLQAHVKDLRWPQPPGSVEEGIR